MAEIISTGSSSVRALTRTIALSEGVKAITISEAATIGKRAPNILRIDGGASNRNVTFLAEVEALDGAGPYLIHNSGTTNDLVIRSSAPATITTLTPGEWATVYRDGSTWYASELSAAAAAAILASANTWALLQTYTTGAEFPNAAYVGFGSGDVVFTSDGTDVDVTGTGKLALRDDVAHFVDTAAPTKRVRLDAGAVTAGQTRVLAMPDANVTMAAYAPTLLNVADEAAFKAATNLEAGTDYNAYDAGLASLVANADAAAGLPYVTGANTWASLAGFSADHFVKATVACADASGGATTALMSVQLHRFDGTTAVASARQVLLVITSTQYIDAAGPTNASLSLGTVTAGSIVATIVAGSIYLIETSAAGLFGCTVTDTDDGTLYFACKTADGGVSDLATAAVVLGSNSDAAIWSA